jgi:hypothetical protein
MQVEIGLLSSRKTAGLERCLWESPAFDETEELVESALVALEECHRGYPITARALDRASSVHST